MGGHSFTTIDAGPYHTCGLSADGAAHCWGANGPLYQRMVDRNGLGYALGTATTDWCDNPITVGDPPEPYRGAQWPCSTTPLAVSGDLSFQSITAGLWSSCGVAMSGVTYCRGMNGFGNLGTGTEEYTQAPAPVTGSLVFDEVVAGAVNGCGLVNRAAYCWGGQQFPYGFLGTGVWIGSDSPVAVIGHMRFASVVPSDANNIYSFTCGITTEGAIYCWGTNKRGQLGTDQALPTCSDDLYSIDTPCTNVPLPVVGGIDFQALDTGSAFACGVGENRAVYCWGRNEFGQLGDGTTTDQATPVQVQAPIRR